ncbi:hypothetical protein OCOL_000757 [Ordospora colligata]|uniref:Uncharacterized protein n=1 Tax=Ordospora colligata OC4 TaxID=1354746 RepID=A0A0B2UEE6_9MICR|nr:uncharacterized protein M896_070390 [Ordospora colligata OC4]KHN69471.1 hypothetical protein M896_070390 [Ordospora colligata OC4]TBU15215.1 hypothetical protein CWI41_070390 [Ordospora colligata]TBU15286.1 hypothetical protein CWI40_070390 [Ordospora colligata]
MDIRKITKVKYALFFAITVWTLMYIVLIVFEYAMLNARRRIFEEILGRYRCFQEVGNEKPSFWMLDYFYYVWMFVRCLIIKDPLDGLPCKNAKEKMYFLDNMLRDFNMIIICAELAKENDFPIGKAINQLLGADLSKIHEDNSIEHNTLYKRFIELAPKRFENVQLELQVFGNAKKMSLHTHVVLVVIQYLHQK